MRAIMAIVLAAVLACCNVGDTCGEAEASLEACGLTYWGDDVCMSMADSCSAEEHNVLAGAFECIASNCDEPKVCDPHFSLLGEDCMASFLIAKANMESGLL